MTLSIAIPDELAQDLGDSEPVVQARVMADLAVIYYVTGLVSAGRAAEMAGVRRAEFEELLMKRGALRSYSLEDWIVDSSVSVG